MRISSTMFHVQVTTFANDPKVIGRTVVAAPDRAAALRIAVAAVRKREGIAAGVSLTGTVLEQVAAGVIEPAKREAVPA